MKTVPSTFPVCSLAAATAMALSFTVSAGELRFVERPIPGQYIVVLKQGAAALKAEGSTRPAIASVARQMGQDHRVTVVRTYESVLRGFLVKASDRALASLVADPRVAYVEEDGIVYASGIQSGATWGLDRVDQRDLPLNTTYSYDTTAATVHAYVIDTGIYPDNDDFGGRVSGGFTAVNDGNGTTDCHSHGTHVAGTVGGATWGVAKQVQLHPVRVLNCAGSGDNSGVIAGVDWVAAHHINPAVANLSLGGGVSQAVDDSITNLVNSGVVTVIAAGNDNHDACRNSPGRTPVALTVAATGPTDARAFFSNYGKCVDLFAPGLDIKSAGNTSPDSTNIYSGTSMASPHVAGAVALYLAKNPNSTPEQTSLAVIKASSKGRVINPMGSPNRFLFTKAFNGANGPIFLDFSATNIGSMARFSDSATSNSGAIVSRLWEFGDGSSSTAIRPTHLYSRSGTYTVTLTVTDNAGYIASKVKAVNIR